MAATETFQDEILAQFARIGKALSSPPRLKLLFLLMQGERSVENVARSARLSLANASQHLQVLKSSRLVTSRKAGQQVHYQLAAPAVEDFLHALEEFAKERLAGVRELMQAHEKKWAHIPRTTPAQLRARPKKAAFTLADVRPPSDFEAGHLPGALSVPLAELEYRTGEFSLGGEVVVYGGSGFCTPAFRAAELLLEKGFSVTTLEGGLLGWKAAGFPLEKGSSAR